MRSVFLVIFFTLGAIFTPGAMESADAQGIRDRAAYEGAYLDRAHRQRYVRQRSYSQRYRWCAYYGPRIGASNCYFVTREQCMAAVSGVGGYCGPSPYLD